MPYCLPGRFGIAGASLDALDVQFVDGQRSVSEYHHMIRLEANDRRLDAKRGVSGIEDEVAPAGEVLEDVVGGGWADPTEQVRGRRRHGCPHGLDERLGDRVGGRAYRHGGEAGRHRRGNPGPPRNNHRERSGPVPGRQGAKQSALFGDDAGEVHRSGDVDDQRIVLRTLLHGEDPVDCHRVLGQAAQAVHGFRGERDQAASSQEVGGAIDDSSIDVVGVDPNPDRHEGHVTAAPRAAPLLDWTGARRRSHVTVFILVLWIVLTRAGSSTIIWPESNRPEAPVSRSVPLDKTAVWLEAGLSLVVIVATPWAYTSSQVDSLERFGLLALLPLMVWHASDRFAKVRAGWLVRFDDSAISMSGLPGRSIAWDDIESVALRNVRFGPDDVVVRGASRRLVLDTQFADMDDDDFQQWVVASVAEHR